MKKISNTIRIGMVRRGPASPKVNEDHSSSLDHEQTNQQPVKEQQLQTQISQNTSVKDGFPDQKGFSEYVSPNNVRLHDLHTNNHQYPNDLNSRISQSPLPHLQQQKLANLHEIPTKTKWLTPTKIVLGVIAAIAIAAAIIVPTILLTKSTGSTTTVITSTTTTTVTSRTIISAYWDFDNVTTDLYNNYGGVGENNPLYTVFNVSTLPYVGYGRAIYLDANLTQYVLVSTFMDLSYTSFTIEAWIYSITSTGDRGLFGQCQCSLCSNQCLYFILRSGHLYIGFTSNDLMGSTVMSMNTWYHVAFVYNYQTQQQILYVNGVQDTIKSNAQPYQGKNGSIQIGSTQVYSTPNYFHGYIDNVAITTRAKSSDEILYDASVFVYYSFDLPDQTIDSGPNHLNGTLFNTVTTSGRVNQALRLTGSGSYFQAYGFYYVPWGVSNARSFSTSMWIYPTAAMNSTFVQFFAASLSVNSCTNLLGIAASTSTACQISVISSSTGPSYMTGPFISQNTWTHISLTFSSTNGYTLYVNGVLFGATGASTYPTSNTVAYLFIGFNTNCNAASINVPYQGAIDEFYIHSRELTQTDVTALANS